MDIITVKDKSFKPYISEEKLQVSVEKIASKIAECRVGTLIIVMKLYYS